MARTIDLNKLAARAEQALSRLPWWQRLGAPAIEAPAWLRTATSTLPADMVRTREFLAAKSAVDAWSAAADLRSRAMALLDDPAIRAVAGDERTLHYLAQNPDQAMNALIRHSGEYPDAFRDGSPLAEALAVASEAVSFHETYTSSDLGLDSTPSERSPRGENAGSHAPRPSAPGPKPVNKHAPSTASWDELIRKEHLTKQEYAQLLAWAETDVEIADNTLPADWVDESPEAEWPDDEGEER